MSIFIQRTISNNCVAKIRNQINKASMLCKDICTTNNHKMFILPKHQINQRKGILMPISG